MAIQGIPTGGGAGAANLVASLMQNRAKAQGGAGAPVAVGGGNGVGIGGQVDLASIIGQLMQSLGGMKIPGAGG